MFDFVIFSQNQALASRILCFLCAIRIDFAHLPVTAHTRKDITFSKKAPFLLWYSVFLPAEQSPAFHDPVFAFDVFNLVLHHISLSVYSLVYL